MNFLNEFINKIWKKYGRMITINAGLLIFFNSLNLVLKNQTEKFSFTQWSTVAVTIYLLIINYILKNQKATKDWVNTWMHKNNIELLIFIISSIIFTILPSALEPWFYYLINTNIFIKLIKNMALCVVLFLNGITFCAGLGIFLTIFLAMFLSPDFYEPDTKDTEKRYRKNKINKKD